MSESTNNLVTSSIVRNVLEICNEAIRWFYQDAPVVVQLGILQFDAFEAAVTANHVLDPILP